MAALGVLGLTSAPSEIVVFGPETYQRQPGAPATVSKQFTMASANGEYVLRVANNGITSATVVLNGSNVLQPNDFTGKQTTSIEKPVTLRAGTNTLSVELRSQGSLSISIVDLRGDVTPPTITAVPSPLANAAGWNNGPVTVTFTCSDADSTVATCPAPVTVSTEGSGQIVTGTAVDSAGNSASVNLTLNIDLTPPVVTATPAPEANGDGWNNTPVTVTFSASDGLSGLAPGTLTAPVTLSSDGSGLTATGQATDIAGNTGSVTRTGINIDATKPVITATPSAPPNANGWNNADVTVTFACSDEGSFVATCPLPVTVTAEGASQTVSGTAIDKAGNTASVSVTLSIDKTPPVVTSTQSPDANAAGWNNGQVTVTFSASDGLSGVAPGSTTAPVTLLADGTNLSATGQATDLAGNVGSHTRSGINIDTGAPVITPSVSVAPNANGWNNTDVTVTFTCSDAAIAVCPEPVTVTTEGAGQVVTRIASDKAGNAAEASVTLNIDKTPPVLSGTQSPDPNAAGWNNSPVTVTFAATDALSGVAPGTLTAPIVLTSDGASLSASGEAIDLAGNVGRLTRTGINIDMTAPLIATTRTPAANGNGWNNTAVTVHFECSDGLSGIVSCPPDQPISTEGSGQPVAGSVTDIAGNTATTSTTVNIDTTPPVVTLSQPTNGTTGTTVFTPSVNVSGTATDGGSGVQGVTCNGVPATVTGGALSCVASLTPGANIVEAIATDRAGNSASSSLGFTYNRVPIITIASPANLSYTNISPTTISGTVDDPSGTVTINSIQATVVNGNFSLALPLAEGPNIVTATASTVAGATGTASLTITLDTTPPRVTVTSPPDHFETRDASVFVSGIINDIVVGTVNAEQAGVTVNGVTAQVANRTFVANNVALALGPNVIQVVGRDRVGNQATTQVTVTRQAVAAKPRIQLVSGNGQSGVIGDGLSNPLVVEVTDAAGNPVADKPVIFKVTQNDGFVRSNGGSQMPTTIATTDPAGRAMVEWTLGKRAGAGGNTVEAYSVGFEGTAIFTATGTQGTAGKIVVDTGNNQIGPTGQRLPKPFIAVVVDEGNNRLAGVPVTFTVSDGGGDFDGQPSLTVTSDPDGRVAATLTLGTQEGNSNNLVSATFDSNQGFPAAFTASGRAPGDPTKTTITGVVLDNSNVPIPGVTVRAVNTEVLHANGNAANLVTPVQTDAQGQFTVTNAPVGYSKLIVDGSTATSPGSYPSLEYDLVTVAGQANTVQQPIFLLPLNTANSLCVTDTTGGGTLTIPEAPGFSLTFGPGQVTFPGGSKTGCVSVTVVNSDKVPMSPGFGQQPRFIVTIQPAGAMFNPPAPITLPNVDGLKPRAVTEMYSFDHDISSFVAIGTGTVSENGLVIRSNPGVGVLKAGWHCGGNPNAIGTTANCAVCLFCVGVVPPGSPPGTVPGTCVPDPGQVGNTCVPAGNSCVSGTCGAVGGASAGCGSLTNLPDGSPCIALTGSGVCYQGICQPQKPPGCDPSTCNGICTGNGCVLDTCTPQTYGQLCDAGGGSQAPGWCSTAGCNGNSPSQCGASSGCAACVTDFSGQQECSSCSNGQAPVAGQCCADGNCCPSQLAIAPVTIRFLAQRSFSSLPAGDTISVQASTGSSATAATTFWSVTATIGQVRNQMPANGQGALFSFIPDPPSHPQYGSGGSFGRSAPLSYVVSATACTLADTRTITQDERDVIRQEYVNHGLTPPQLDELSPAIATTHWPARASLNAINGLENPNAINGTAYDLIVGDPGPLAESVRLAYNALLNSDVQVVAIGTTGLGALTPIVRAGAINIDTVGTLLNTTPCNGAAHPLTCDDRIDGDTIVAGPNGIAETSISVGDYDLVIKSAWRNPERNERVGGARNSLHQRGNALDIFPVAIPGRNLRELVCVLKTAGNQVAVAFAEDNPANLVACNAFGVTHIHVQR